MGWGGNCRGVRGVVLSFDLDVGEESKWQQYIRVFEAGFRVSVIRDAIYVKEIHDAV